MFNKRKPDVLVVGAGPVGMVTALMLIQRGLTVDVIDKLNGICAHSNSFLLSPAVLEVFEKLDLINDILRDARLIDKIELFDEHRSRAKLDLGELDCRFPFIASLPLSRLEKILVNALKQVHQPVKRNHRFAGIEWVNGELKVEVDRLSDHFTGYAVMHGEWAVDKEFTYYPRWVIGADGYSSVVRNMIKVDYPMTSDMQDYLVFEYKTKPGVNTTMRVCMADGLISTQCPLPGNATRFSFEMDALNLSDDFRDKNTPDIRSDDSVEPCLSVEVSQNLISKRIPWGAAELNHLSWRIGLPFGPHMATRFFKDDVFLLGDAAHSGCPISMRGLNMGVLEGQKIADEMLQFINQESPEGCFGTIEHEMRNEWMMLMTLGQQARPMVDTDPWILRNSGKILQSLPVTGRELEALALQLGLELSLSLKATA